jgi:branched-chain amino acid transport system ATP-binding protein
LIEQNATAALEVADRAYVLESGKVKMSGSAKELSSDDKVTKAYLGH